jgi:hypothetical protein
MWNDRLAALAREYPTAVLSIVDPDGYPLCVRCTVRLDATRQVAIIADPPAQAMDWRGKACLLFHQFNERLEGLRQFVILGTLGASEGLLTLQVNKFVTSTRRQDTDRIPHASTPWQMAQFLWLGWRNARAYIAKRGAPWPPIPFDAIIRAVDEG